MLDGSFIVGIVSARTEEVAAKVTIPFKTPKGFTGDVVIKATPEAFPFGLRRDRPISIYFDDIEALNELDEFKIDGTGTWGPIPGVVYSGSVLKCTFDGAQAVFLRLGIPTLLQAEIVRRQNMSIPLPGKARYAQLEAKEKRREAQQSGVLFLLRQSYGILGDPPRAGKCMVMIIMTVLLDSKRVLVLCNSLGRRSWAREFLRWSHEESAILEGRAAREFTVLCPGCRGSGMVEGLTCHTCQGVGDRTVLCHLLQKGVRTENSYTLTPEQQEENQRRIAKWEEKGRKGKEPILLKGKRTSIKVETDDIVCPTHGKQEGALGDKCPVCKNIFDAELASKRVIISNYELVLPHRVKNGWGQMVTRADLPGWGPTIGSMEVDFAILDEAHKLRGGDMKKDKERIWDCVYKLLLPIPRVYAVTGTPMAGFTRHLWGILDLISGGLWR